MQEAEAKRILDIQVAERE